MKVLSLIVNPAASGLTEGVVHDVEDVLSSAGTVRTLRTEGPGHGGELAEAMAHQSDALVVISGDGGANEVLNGISRGDVIPIGFLPGGRTSAFPRGLGLPRSPVRAARRVAEALRAGRTRTISVGSVNGRRFAVSAGVGFDAELVARINALRKESGGRRPNDAKYVKVAADMLGESGWRLDPSIEVRGSGKVAMLFVANGDPYTYAGPLGLRIAPQARFELGLDLIAPRRLGPGMTAWLLGSFLTGRMLGNHSHTVFGHDLDRIEVACDAPTRLHTDGEDRGWITSAVFECERGAVRILC